MKFLGERFCMVITTIVNASFIRQKKYNNHSIFYVIKEALI